MDHGDKKEASPNDAEKALAWKAAQKLVQEQKEKQALEEAELAQQKKERESREKAEANRERRVDSLGKYARPARARKRSAAKAREEEACLKEKQAKSLADQRRLGDHEKSELVEAKMRFFYDAQDDSEGGGASSLKVSTYESAFLDLQLRGIENIGQTWAKLSAENGLEVGPHNEIRQIVDC